MIVARAPLRIPLGGGGTDLPSYAREHGGFVIGLAIARYVRVCANVLPLERGVRYTSGGAAGTAGPDEIPDPFVRAAMMGMCLPGGGIELLSLADVPSGTGLGLSSAFAVALVAALHALANDRLPRHELAAAAVAVERAAVGPAVGVQDHYLSALGGLHALRVTPDGTVNPLKLPVAADVVDALSERLLLYYTGIRRSAIEFLREQAASTERREPAVLESLHTVKRVGGEIHDALVAGDLDAIGRLMDLHWRAKKRRSKAIAPAEVDDAYVRAVKAGALGGKLVGAGGGGFLLLYVPPDAQCSVRAAMSDLRELPYAPDRQGVVVVDTDAAGAP